MIVSEYRGGARQRREAIQAAVEAVRAGQLIVLPTDTVYGIGCDPFDAGAVERLLAAKGRGREKPSPVLVAGIDQAESLTEAIPGLARTLIEQLWPGALTVVLPAKPLGWDLGETGGTVALRMPDHPAALELLRATGPLAVSSANLTARQPATTAAQAARQLGEKVAVYLDAGACGGGTPSTVVAFDEARGDPGSAQTARDGGMHIAPARAVSSAGAPDSATAGERRTPGNETQASDVAQAAERTARASETVTAAQAGERGRPGEQGSVGERETSGAPLRVRILREGAITRRELERFADVVMP